MPVPRCLLLLQKIWKSSTSQRPLACKSVHIRPLYCTIETSHSESIVPF
jgi:hypothetical protein